MTEKMKGKLDFGDAKKHMLAGKSTLTFKNSDTGKHLTYKVNKHKEKNVWFVNFLSGSDNINDYSYLGVITPNYYTKHLEFKLTANSKAGMDSVVFKGFNWIFNRIANNITFPDNLEAWHEGVCGRCGRTLTHPESIETGFGPRCITKINP